MLKRFLISAACLLLLLSVSAMAGTKASQNQKPQQATNTKPKGIPASTYKGKMQLSDDFFNFGYLPRSSKVNHIFWLKNVGNDSLEIISIKPG